MLLFIISNDVVINTFQFLKILEFSFSERNKVKPCTVKYTQRSSINFQELKLSTNRGGSKRVAKFLSESNTFHIRSKAI